MNDTRQLLDYIKQKKRFRYDKDLAEALGVDPTFMSHSIRLNRPPWARIESTFPDSTQEFRNHFYNLRQEAKNVQEEQKVVGSRSSDYREVPVYNVRVSAGHGEFQGIEVIKQQLQMPKLFLPENGKIGFVKVEGDSMFPTVNHGDHVAVEFDTGYTSDGLYLIRVDDAVFVKRLQREFGQIRIISDNQMYREQVVQQDDGQQFQLIGRVALIMRMT